MRATKAIPLTIVMFGSLAGACAPAQANALLGEWGAVAGSPGGRPM